jgi:hypothetical protein
MNNERYKQVLKALEPFNLSQRGLTEMFGYRSHATAGQWADGKTAVPPDVAEFLENTLEFWRVNKPR